MMRERPEFDRFGNHIGVGALSDTIRGYQGSAKKGEARRTLENGVSYAPPVKAAPSHEDAPKEGFLPGLTNRMRARMQGFPDTWEFVGGLGPVVNQIGSAVAPPVGKAMGLALILALKGWDIGWEPLFTLRHGLLQRSLSLLPPGMFLEAPGDPSEVAKTILFLAYDEASYIVGSELVIDGGMSNL